MWIRSQDKDALCEVKNLMVERGNGKFGIVELIKTSYGCATKIVLGEYSTEEKAIKVLDMIQERIARSILLKHKDMILPIKNYGDIFQMPQDSEVE